MEFNKVSLNVGVWLAVVLGVVAILRINQTEDAIKRLPPPGSRLPAANVQFFHNADDTCTQIDLSDNKPHQYVMVYPGQSVIWRPADVSLALEVKFPEGGSPFFDFKTDSGSVGSGGAVGPHGQQYAYDKVIIGNNNACKNILGIVMDH